MQDEGGPANFRDQSAGYLVNHLARLFARALYDEIAPYGVAPGQFAQLLALYEQDGLTQQELCKLVRIEQPTMANTLKRMERDGLIERLPDPEDRRRTRVMLTRRAKELRPELISAARSVNAAATAGLSDQDIRTLIKTLHHLTSNLEGDSGKRSVS